MHNSSGNVVFIIFTAVFLFGLLTFAVTSGNRTGETGLQKNQAELDSSGFRACQTAINAAVKRLRSNNGCKSTEISYETSDGANINPDAPSNKSCHVFDSNGAGIEPCGTYAVTPTNDCDLTTLAIGESCGAVLYAGLSGGNRIYTTPDDQSPKSWNNGTSNWVITGVSSLTYGKPNTDTLVGLADIGSPYEAAVACRALGSEWYLPARDEVFTLYTNRAAIGNFVDDERYWSSSETTADAEDKSWTVRFRYGGELDDQNKFTSYRFRCVRRD